MNNLYNALSNGFIAAFSILFVFWILFKFGFIVTASPSGWWWFGCLIVGIFFGDLEE